MTSDVQILRGFGGITNMDNVKPGLNIDEIEKQLINGGLVKKSKDPQDKFNDEINTLAKEYGINLGMNEPAKKSNDYRTEPSRPVSSPLPEMSFDAEPTPDAAERSLFSGAGSSAGGSLYDKTQEQERRSHISSVMRDMNSPTSFNFETEKKNDMKCAMLEEIDSLLYSLKDEEVDLAKIPVVDSKNSYEEIEVVLKMLRYKNDRIRYCSLAEESLIFLSYGAEELFDGRRLWLGKYSPDLTDWHTSVTAKLSRIRHDTSTIMGQLMEDYNIGSFMRILLELIPNAFVYSNTRKRRNKTIGYSDVDLADVNARIRNM